MPNHILNVITLKGTPERITEILEKIKDDEIGIGSIDFEKIIPMPPNIYRGDLGLEERELYGKYNWYDWSIENWGTKWNSYGYCRDFKYSQFDPIIFQTAWRAPHPVIEKLFMMFQDVEIVHEWADEGVARNCGRRIYNQEGLNEWYPLFKKATIRFGTALWNTYGGGA